jgi:hypothetical protein
MASKVTRRRFLTALSAGATYLALTNTVGCKLLERTPKVKPLPNVTSTHPKRVWTFRSRPDLRPPVVDVTTRAHDTAPGYIFIAPKWGGQMILDDRGQVVWFRPLARTQVPARDFKAQNYRGEPVLTWEEGEYVIADSSYREITRVRAGNGYKEDHHEFLITSQDTALITIYDRVPRDLSSVGGPEDSKVVDGIVQEVDIETGEVLFEWHSLDHIGLEETYVKPLKDSEKPLDYFHLNSIDVDHDNNLLICARNTSGIYKIDRKSGEVIWRLSGQKSDFEMGPGTQTAYHHDARRQPDGTITIFDNGDTVFDDRDVPTVVEESRGIVLELDEEEMVATLVREYTHPDKQFAHAGGNMQVLPNGNVFIGWGRALVFSEFSRDGDLLFSADFPPSFKRKDGSYRVFRFPWSGQPSDRPAAVAERASNDEVKVYASWNGATEVANWEVLAGPSPGQLEAVESVPRDGFETAMLVRNAESYLAVRAKHRSGQVLGTSEPVKL